MMAEYKYVVQQIFIVLVYLQHSFKREMSYGIVRYRHRRKEIPIIVGYGAMEKKFK